MTNSPKSLSNCKGMTLIEVLVAAIVIAVGLLGVASMQVTALKGASNADYRSRAIDITASLADRMRANLEGVDANSYNNNTAEISANCNTLPDPICAMSPDGSITADECNPDQMAAFDLWEIMCRNGVQTALPGGTMSVVCTDAEAAPNDTCLPLSPMVVTITWEVTSDNIVPETENVVTTIIPGAP
jgi:type IV pilus assembly protein PilV